MQGGDGSGWWGFAYVEGVQWFQRKLIFRFAVNNYNDVFIFSYRVYINYQYNIFDNNQIIISKKCQQNSFRNWVKSWSQSKTVRSTDRGRWLITVIQVWFGVSYRSILIDYSMWINIMSRRSIFRRRIWLRLCGRRSWRLIRLNFRFWRMLL